MAAGRWEGGGGWGVAHLSPAVAPAGGARERPHWLPPQPAGHGPPPAGRGRGRGQWLAASRAEASRGRAGAHIPQG